MASRSAGGGTVLASGIRTRERKERKLYSDDWALGDEEIEGHHTFNLDEKIKTDKFNLDFVKDMSNINFSLAFFQKNGFNWPLLFKNKEQLGIVIPDKTFSINDVRVCVGSRRMLDVMDVNTQKNVEMTMKDWQRYYESEDKDKLLNVISLEFSHTKLENLVEAPTVVRQIDWVENVWPRHLKEAQTESTNVLEDMMYPKVQKYCLMSVAGCYTDFHIDFGGTSVWYHILKGRKIFWLIPPSERNLQLYESWVLSGKQGDIFFGDTVEKCARVQLEAGDTFFIPTGWIHAVYTPDDSLVFGGNFLHSFGIEKQLRIAHVEDTTHVPQKFRYPFFTEMLWYFLERYVHVLLGRSHLCLPEDEEEKYTKSDFYKTLSKIEENPIHITQYELHGMKAIVVYLHSLPTSKKYVPELIKDPIALIRDVRIIVEQHRYDSPEKAITDKPIMVWWEREAVKYTVKRSYPEIGTGTTCKKRRQSTDVKVFSRPPNANGQRNRRVRCRECDSCTRADCRECSFCKDMTKYGGPGTMKQTCKLKKCISPTLAQAATCNICRMDGWHRESNVSNKAVPGVNNSLMECLVCYKISHVDCAQDKFNNTEGIVNEDITNSWECPECVSLGYNKEYKHNRVASSRFSSGGSDSNVKTPEPPIEEEMEKKPKLEPLSEGSQIVAEDSNSINGTVIRTEKEAVVCDPVPPKLPTWDQLQARVSYPLVRPAWVVRPTPPIEDEEEEVESGSDTEDKPPKVPSHPTTTKKIMIRIFSNLSKKDLLAAMLVCRQWACWSIHPSLWKKVSLPHEKLQVKHITGLVRRQSQEIVLDWSDINEKQFLWMIQRIPQLDRLSVQGISYGELRPLVSPYCPALTYLDLSFCEGINNESLTNLLKAPPYHRPGHRDTSSRLRQLSHLKLAGTRVGDIGVGVIVRSLPFLTHLDMNSCLDITDEAIELLASPTSIVSHSLKNLDIRWCNGLTPLALPHLASLPLLCELALNPCKYIPSKAVLVWGKNFGYSFNNEDRMSRPARKLDLQTPSDGESNSTPKNDNEKNGKTSIKDNSKEISADSKEISSPSKKTKSSGTKKEKVKLSNKRKVEEMENNSKPTRRRRSSRRDSEVSKDDDNSRDSFRRSERSTTKVSAKSKNKSEATTSDIKKEDSRGDKKLNVESKTKKDDSGKEKKATSEKGTDSKSKKNEQGIEAKTNIESKSNSEGNGTSISDAKTKKDEQENEKKSSVEKNRDSKNPKKKKVISSRNKTPSKSSVDSRSSSSKGTNARKSNKHSKSPRGEEAEDIPKSKSDAATYASKLRRKSVSQDREVDAPVPEENRKKSTDESKKIKETSKRGRRSSTSSSPCSPIVLPSTKKLKIELEHIGKFSRRRSEGVSKTKSNSSSEKTGSSSRDRPERHHRSPRRLSNL